MTSLRTTFLILIGFLGFGIFLSTYFTVDQRERAIVTRFGKIERVADPGLHFKVPFVNSTVFYRTDIQDMRSKNKVNTYTVDNQEVDIIFTLFYRLDPNKLVYVHTNAPDYKERLFSLAVDRLKAELGKVNVNHVAEKRAEIRDNIREVLANDAEAIGVTVTDFQLTNIDYADSFRHAVSQAASAKAQVETREQEKQQAIKTAETARISALGQANAVREKASGDADATVMRAKAEAEAIRLQGEAQAKAIFAQAEALRQNPNLVDLRKAERWDGQLPKQMLSGVIPFMEFKSPAEATK